MSRPPRADLGALIDVLLSAEVEFIVVGGVGAILHGALAMTQDLDIVHRLTPANVERLTVLLAELDAIVREPTQRELRPTPVHLAGGGQLNLLTSLGPLDLLGHLHDGRGYEELLPHSEEVTDGPRTIRVVDLPTLIEIKTTAGRTKDRLVVPMLLALLRERQTS